MSQRPVPDQPAPGENDRTIVGKPAASSLEHDTTIKGSAKNVEFAQTIKDAATGRAVPPRSQNELLTGSRFGRYEIRKQLGRGAMGTVYLALDTKLDREVAVKIPTFGPDDGPEDVERFYREARSMATLSHPNLCPVYDVDEIDGVHYLTMQFVDGRPMDDFLKGGKSHPPKQVAAVMRKLAMALEEAHRAGVIHRDLKPANIMLDQRNEPIIMDFGLAQRRKENETTLTHVGQVMGTPSYMSPEQVKARQGTIGPASDIYALGVICYQLLTGKLPFMGSLGEVMAAILTEEPEPPSKLNPNVDRSIEAICLKAMSKEIDRRYASSADLGNALRGYLRGERQPEEDSKLIPSKAAPQEPTTTVNTTGKEVALAGDFFAELIATQNEAPVTAPRTSGGRAKSGRGTGRRKGGASRKVSPWVWIAGGSVALVLVLLSLFSPRGSSRGTPSDELTARTEVAKSSANKEVVSIPAQKSDAPTDPGPSAAKPPVAAAPMASDDKDAASVEVASIPAPAPKADTPTDPTPPTAKPPVDAASPNMDMAKQQRECASREGLPVEKEVRLLGGAKLTLVLIPPGEFVMGDDEFGPKHPVRITKPFYLGKYEVTQVQWQAVMKTSPWKGKKGTTEGANTPATHLIWADIEPFLAKLNSSRSDKTVTFALPTEAQWEYACRAGTTTPYYSGDKEEGLRQVAWFGANSGGKTHPVGELKPNGFGLFDMHGNVWEWCSDWHAKDYATSPTDDPTGPKAGQSMVIRGGGWDLPADSQRSAKRGLWSPSKRGEAYALGVRVAAVVSGSSPVSDSKPVNREVAEITGEYLHEPKLNDWHQGRITVVSAEKGEFKWTNDAGRSWSLTLDRKEGVLRTGPDNPYYKDNPDSRVLQPVFATSPRPGQRIGRLIGFKWGGGIYRRTGDLKTP